MAHVTKEQLLRIKELFQQDEEALRQGICWAVRNCLGWPSPAANIPREHLTEWADSHGTSENFPVHAKGCELASIRQFIAVSFGEAHEWVSEYLALRMELLDYLIERAE